MKTGDLVSFVQPVRGLTRQNGSLCLYLVIDVTPTKKSWHRRITLYNNQEVISLPWTRKSLLKTIR